MFQRPGLFLEIFQFRFRKILYLALNYFENDLTYGGL